MGQVEAWLQHVIDNKCRQRTDASVLEHTDRNPKKLNKQTKLDLFKNVKFPNRKECDEI